MEKMVWGFFLGMYWEIKTPKSGDFGGWVLLKVIFL